MRASCLSVVFAIAVACSGQPFTANGGSERAGAGTGGGEQRPTGDRTAGKGGSVNPSERVPNEPSSTAGIAATLGGAAGSVPGAGAATAGTTTAGTPGSATGGTSASGGTEVSEEGGASGGDAGAPAPSCPSRTAGNWEIGYFPELRDATTQESHPFFLVTNHGAPPTTLDRVEIRYYFTREAILPETAVCFWVTGDLCSLTKLQFGDVAVPTPNASRYLSVTFPGASRVMVGVEPLDVRVGFQTRGAALLQTNDYSFDRNAASPTTAVPFPYKPWLRATLYVDGELAWGAEPCNTSGNVAAL